MEEWKEKILSIIINNLPKDRDRFSSDTIIDIYLKEEMFEELSRLRKMRRKMRLVTNREDWYCIDGDGSPKEVWNQIKRILVKLDSNVI